MTMTLNAIFLSLSLSARATALRSRQNGVFRNNRVPAILIKYNVYIDTKLR